MTLLLALSYESFVMQVSDRCLSRGGVPEPDERNKAVVWCNSASIAFTGNAYRDLRETKPVDDWIVETVAGATTVEELFAALIDGATDWLTGVRRVHPQAFSIVGWARQANGKSTSYAGLVSNFHDERGNIRRASREFNWLIVSRNENARPQSWFFSHAGANLYIDEVRMASRGLKRIMKSGGDPARAADLLTQIIRLVHKRNRGVGTEIMVTCLPKPGGSTPEFFATSRAGKPNLDHPSFFYRREDGDSSVAFAPQSVCAHVVSAIQEITYLNESGSDVEIVSDFRLLPGHPFFQKPP